MEYDAITSRSNVAALRSKKRHQERLQQERLHHQHQRQSTLQQHQYHHLQLQQHSHRNRHRQHQFQQDRMSSRSKPKPSSAEYFMTRIGALEAVANALDGHVRTQRQASNPAEEGGSRFAGIESGNEVSGRRIATSSHGGFKRHLSEDQHSTSINEDVGNTDEDYDIDSITIGAVPVVGPGGTSRSPGRDYQSVFDGVSTTAPSSNQQATPASSSSNNSNRNTDLPLLEAERVIEAPLVFAEPALSPEHGNELIALREKEEMERIQQYQHRRNRRFRNWILFGLILLLVGAGITGYQLIRMNRSTEQSTLAASSGSDGQPEQEDQPQQQVQEQQPSSSPLEPTNSNGTFVNASPDVDPDITDTFNDTEYLLTILEPLSGYDALRNSTTNQYQAMQWLLQQSSSSNSTTGDDDVNSLQIMYSDQQLREWYALVVAVYSNWASPELLDSSRTMCKNDGTELYLKNNTFCCCSRSCFGFVPTYYYTTVECQFGFVTSLELETMSPPYGPPVGPLPEELVALSHMTKFRAATDFGLSQQARSALSMSDWITQFSKLTSLSLQRLSLTGSLPESMKNLELLESLDLSYNYLNGTIPPSVVVAWDQLGSLVLNNNGFYNFPNALTQLTNLQMLDMSCNYLMQGGGLPEFPRRMALQELMLNDNLVACPDCYYNCPARPDHNLTIPESLYLLQGLKILDLSDNKLKGTISSSIGNLHNLEVLGFQWNSLSGQLPSEIGKLTNLVNIYLQHNQLAGALPEIGDGMTLLKELHIEWNNLNGMIPASFAAGMSSLELFNIQANGFNGGLEESFCLPGYSSFVSADCLHDVDVNSISLPEIECTCCSRCCDHDGTSCDIIEENRCLTLAVELGRQNLDRGSSCTCEAEDTGFSTNYQVVCSDSCESCNKDRTLCAVSSPWGYHTLGAMEPRNFATLQYTKGRNETIRFAWSYQNEYRVEMNDESCVSAVGMTCVDGFETFLIDCTNLIEDEQEGKFDGCQRYKSGGVLEVFAWWYEPNLNGCRVKLDNIFF